MTDIHLIFFYFFPIDVLIKNITKKFDPISHKGRKKNIFDNGFYFCLCFQRSPPRQMFLKANLEVILTLKLLWLTQKIPYQPKIYLSIHFCTEFGDKMRSFTMFFIGGAVGAPPRAIQLILDVVLIRVKKVLKSGLSCCAELVPVPQQSNLI